MKSCYYAESLQTRTILQGCYIWYAQICNATRINLSLGKLPAHSQRTRFNHMFLATYAVFKLECLKIKTKLNHFALRTKLLISANQSAFAQLKAISGA